MRIVKLTMVDDEENQGFVKSALVSYVLDDGHVHTFTIGSSMEGFLYPGLIDEILNHKLSFHEFNDTIPTSINTDLRYH